MAQINSTWQNYSSYAELRGALVLHILQKYGSLKAKRILDIGCGVGGTSAVLANHNADVFAIDVKNTFLYNNRQICFMVMPADTLAFKDEIFDIIILQDVVEHLTNLNRVFSEVHRVLTKNGIFYLSTPNRLSPLNFISDPHWGLPLIAILPRWSVKFLVKYVFQKDKRTREDWAALLSLFKLKKILHSQKFKFAFHNTDVAKLLFMETESVVCSPAHLRIVRFLKNKNLQKIIYRIVNNKFGIFNYLLNPTWYIVGYKGQTSKSK